MMATSAKFAAAAESRFSKGTDLGTESVFPQLCCHSEPVVDVCVVFQVLQDMMLTECLYQR